MLHKVEPYANQVPAMDVTNPPVGWQLINDGLQVDLDILWCIYSPLDPLGTLLVHFFIVFWLSRIYLKVVEYPNYVS